MREIKFRVWDNINKMLFGIVGFINNTDESTLRIWWIDDGMIWNSSFPKSRITIEQYTGLKDKNRNNAEVYQGDLYKWCGLTFPITIDDYHGYRFLFGKDQLCRAVIEDGEYVGNIHQNPDIS